MKKYLIILVLIFQWSYSQTINQYKYALVPSKFSFSKVENQHNLNVLSKLMLKKYGFIAYIDTDTIPSFVISNPCEVLYLDVKATNTMFSTRTKVLLKDCKKHIVAESGVGLSKDKEYYTAFNEALRMSFDNFLALKTYQYKPVTQQETPNQPVEAIQVSAGTKFEKGTKYQKVMYGDNFKILDYNGTLILTCYKTSVQNVFIADKNGTKGICYKQNNLWFFEYYVDEKLIKEQYYLE